MEIKVRYDGCYPNLCSGHLFLVIDGKEWDFGYGALSSGGCIRRNAEWEMWAEDGPWDVNKWPDGFPELLKEKALEAINDEIPLGCCGGCI